MTGGQNVGLSTGGDTLTKLHSDTDVRDCSASVGLQPEQPFRLLSLRKQRIAANSRIRLR